MKILVCITHVPDTTSKITFSPDGKELNKQGVQYIIGPYDEYALSKAIDIREEKGDVEITVFNVGTSETDPTIKKALAIGADKAVRVDAEPKDALFVANQIAEYVKSNPFDMILMGRESIDFNGGLVHGMVAEILGLPCVSPIMSLSLEGSKSKVSKEIEGGKEFLELEMPFVAGCQEPIAEWKIPSMRGIMTARTKPVEVIAAIGESSIGDVQFELPAAKSGCKMVDKDNVQELVDLLKNEAKVL